MIVTYNWLKEFVDFDLSPEQLADTLTMLGLEVEGMHTLGFGMDDIVVAVVEEKLQHPNADKLSLCKVNNGSEVLDIVCGAQNFALGDKVALAKIGAVLPGDFKIKRSKIRGTESFGMLCSEKELGLAEASAGIMILSSDQELGRPVFEALGLKDTIYEVGLTPNRADCLSVIGVAREIAAKLGVCIKEPDTNLSESQEEAARIIDVSVLDGELCPRYMARYISGCTISSSPEWLVKRLSVVGIRSINNVVDVTNLVMMELGQPLHAFDCDLLSGRRIIVRRAVDGERFTTLDSQQRVLTTGDLVICDGERPVALAGIMGGQNSEISQRTTTVLLESAAFKPAGIRSTSKRLALHTESSHRFERGIDVEGVARALDRAAALIADLAGGSVARGALDVYSGKIEPLQISLRPEKVNALIGTQLSTAEMATILANLQFLVRQVPDGTLEVGIPPFRVDIEREIDLVEEIARLNGFEKIPVSMPLARVASDRPASDQRIACLVRDCLVAHGMNEIINFSFTSIDSMDKLLLSPEDLRRSSISLTNPLIEEHAVMRTSLLPGVLETVARNMNFRSTDLRLFEMRRIYFPSNDGEEMPSEPIRIAAALTGSREPLGWCQTTELVDYYDAKGIVECLLEMLHIDGITWVANSPEPYYHPGKSCSIMKGRDRIGAIGEIHPTVQENFNIDRPVFCFELDFEKMVRFAKRVTSITVPSRFPDSARDIALLVPEGVFSEQIIESIRGVKAYEVERVDVFDVYRGAGIPEGFKSVAVRVRYCSNERTLMDDEIGTIHSKIIDNLVNKLKVSIR